MKYRKFNKTVSIILAVILAFSGFAICSFAKTLTIVQQPSKRSFYQGVDWIYNKSNVIVLTKDLELKGTVISDGSKQVAFNDSKTPNMFSKSDSGSWSEGSNTIRIYCDDFSGYATTTVSFVKVSSISVVNPPSNTIYVKGIDWKESALGDVEFTSCDLTGLKISAKYADGTTKTISYPENEFLGWSVGQSYSEILPGDATLYATFCGKYAPFDVTFSKTDPFIKGDVTKDGKINSYDALVILQFATGSIALDSTQKRLADVNKDGRINSLDALNILQYSVGKISSF